MWLFHNGQCKYDRSWRTVICYVAESLSLQPKAHFSYFFQISAFFPHPTPTSLPPLSPPFLFLLGKTELLTRSPELPPSSDHRLEILWSGLVISLMLLLAVSYRLHYCRSMQSPCEVGGGREEEEKKGGMRASCSQLYPPAFAHSTSSQRSWDAAVEIARAGRGWGLQFSRTDWKKIWKPFSLEQTKMLNLFFCLCFCLMICFT